MTQGSHYGSQTQVYNGFDATLNARFGKGGQFSGGLSTSRTVTDNCYQNSDPTVTAQLFTGASTATAPRTDAFCHVSPPLSAGTQVKFLVVYPLPWDIQTSAIFQNTPGIPIQATYAATNAQIQTSLGRNLSACPPTGACNATVSTQLIPGGTQYEPRYTQVDLRVSRSFRLAGTSKLRGNFEVFNLFNESAVLGENFTFSATNNKWLTPAQVLGGRLLRLGFMIDF